MAKAPDPPADAPPKGQIVRDPELQAMQKINRIIDSLPNQKAKIRVVSWLRDKLEFPLVEMPKE